MFQHGIHQGAGEGSAIQPYAQCIHLVTFMMLLFGQLPFGSSLAAPTSCLSSPFTFECHHYCVPCAFLLAQEAGPAFSLQLVLGAGSSPSCWALGNSHRELSLLGRWKPGMSNNPLVTRIRFHLLYGNYLRVLEGPLPFPQQPTFPWILKAWI